jgi:uncharacterized protein (DUF1015 family)
MATIRRFRALRPTGERAADVSAVPYDVVTTEEARQLAANNPLSFLHVSRPEIDLPDDVSPYSETAYEMAAKNFKRLKSEAPLSLESTPGLYIYRLQMGTHAQVGVAACCSIDEYDNDTIRKHERTRKDKEDDRTRHILAIGAQTGPVFLTYRPRPQINRLISDTVRSEPLFDFVAPDVVQHTIWRVSDEIATTLVEEFRAVQLLYIADGHHRAASASRARAEIAAKNPNLAADDENNFFLTVLFPSDQLQILAYNRIVTSLNGMSSEEFKSALSQQFELTETNSHSPSRKGEICMFLGGRWYTLRLPHGTTAPMDPVASLDVSLLQERVLDPLLGIKDVRTDKRIDFVGGIRGTRTLEQMVNSGQAAVAFSMFPVNVDELMAISDMNQIMPPKSTWFEPKLRDGLLSHVISNDE